MRFLDAKILTARCEVVGEDLRVFRNRCIWQWAQTQHLTYDRAKGLWERAGSTTPPPGPEPDIANICNEALWPRLDVRTGF